MSARPNWKTLAELMQLRNEFVSEQSNRVNVAKPQLTPFAEPLAHETEELPRLSNAGMPKSIPERIHALQVRLGYAEMTTESKPVIETVPNA